MTARGNVGQMKRIAILAALIGTLACTTPVVSIEPTVYRTRTGEKYHQDGCRYLRKSRIPIPLSRAKELGLGPCSVCRPPAMPADGM